MPGGRASRERIVAAGAADRERLTAPRPIRREQFAPAYLPHASIVSPMAGAD